MGLRPILRVALAFVAVLFLGACLHSYRYESHGQLRYGQDRHGAVLYWFVDRGRLWYGRAYDKPDSGVALSICGAPPKSFDPSPLHQGTLQLSARPGDRQIARVDATGRVIALDRPIEGDDVETCGWIGLDDQEVAVAQLKDGVEPQVVILCRHGQRPMRYPQQGRYLFHAVTKSRVADKDQREGPKPCS